MCVSIVFSTGPCRGRCCEQACSQHLSLGSQLGHVVQLVYSGFALAFRHTVAQGTQVLTCLQFSATFTLNQRKWKNGSLDCLSESIIDCLFCRYNYVPIVCVLDQL